MQLGRSARWTRSPPPSTFDDGRRWPYDDDVAASNVTHMNCAARIFTSPPQPKDNPLRNPLGRLLEPWS